MYRVKYFQFLTSISKVTEYIFSPLWLDVTVRNVLFLVMTSLSLSAQEKFLPVFQFNHISKSDGLPTFETRSEVVRDRQGLIWIGTWAGLVRYDGYSCRVYRQVLNDPNALSGEAIYALYYDSKGRLWIGTWAFGLSLYDPLHDHFVNFRPRKGDSTWLQSNTVTTIREDRSGNIWLRTSEEGIVRVEIPPEYQNEQTSIDTLARHIRFHSMRSKIRGGGTSDIATFGNSSLLVASLKGLYCFNPQKEKITETLESMIAGTVLDTAVIYSIYWQDSTKLWIGTEFEGLFLLDINKDGISVFHKRPNMKGTKRNDRIRDIQMDQDGRLWIVTETGLDLFDTKQNKYLDFLSYNTAPQITALTANLSLDSTGTLWISTGEDGVYYVTRKSTRFPNFGLRNKDGKRKELETIKQWNDSTVWITSEGFIMKVDLRKLEVVKTIDMFKGEKSIAFRKGVISSYNDGKSHLWYGSFGLGLYKFDPVTGRVTNYKGSIQLSEQSRNNDWCRNISSGAGDTLYASAYGGGMLNFSMKSGKFKRVFRGYASYVMQDNKGMVWISDGRKYISVYEPSTGSVRQLAHDANDSGSLSPGRPMQAYQDPQGRIWVSVGPVIDLWDPSTNSFRHFRNEGAQDITFSEFIGSDAQGNILIYFGETFVGILDPSNGRFRNYTTASGLGHYTDNMELLSDGRVMLPNIGAVNIVTPENLSTILSQPPFLITRMSINDTLNIPISMHNSGFPLKLTYEQNTVELEFAAIDLGSTNTIAYKYRLEGLENDWVKTAGRRFVRYAGLNPGSYVFRVSANSIRDEWSPQEISLTIVIAPPWWKTVWFRILSAVALLSLVGLFYRREVGRYRREKQVQQNFSRMQIESLETERKRLASELHDGLGQNLLVINNELHQFLSEQKEPQEDLRRVASMVQESVESVREISSNLHPHHIERLGFCAAVQAMTENISHSSKLKIECLCDKLDHQIPKEFEIHVYRIIQEGLANVVRHALAKNVKVSVRVLQNSIDVNIADDGCGFDINEFGGEQIPKQTGDISRGFGLSSMSERARIIGATLTIDSSPSSGTTIHLTLPLS